MSSVRSVPGVEVGVPWVDGYEHVRTAGALEVLATLHRTSGPARAELPEARPARAAELAGEALPEFLTETKNVRQGVWHVTPLPPGLEHCVASGGSITGERGAGRDGKPKMSTQLTPEDLDTMQRGCRAYDPDNVAGPAKDFPTPRPCGQYPNPRTAAADVRDPAIGQCFRCRCTLSRPGRAPRRT